ncbi:hypothetical protein R1sor_018651 [Riccia sorocarpa]|uniref:Uncharacterized protein n=1 Tax=Riccia sorocarpa TaxID=122646 RepID=A0ABD3IBZ7_9MARC
MLAFSRSTKVTKPVAERVVREPFLDQERPLLLAGGIEFFWRKFTFTHKTLLSPPSSPPKGPRELTGPVFALQDKLRTSPQLGIVHLALHSDQIGLIMSWKSDIISVAEPGEMAEGFLQTVVANMRIGVTGKARKKRDSQLPKFSSFSSLVASCPRFMIVGGLHKASLILSFVWKSDIISVAEPGEMAEGFLQTVVANMRIGVTGKARKKRDSQLPKFSSFSSLVASCPRFIIVGGLHRFMGRHTQVLPYGQEVGSYLFRRTLRWMVGGWRDRIVICTGSPGSDWEDSDLDKLDSSFESQEREEKDLASFISTLYDALFRDGLGIEAALEHALEAHVKQQYRCHLPQFF